MSEVDVAVATALDPGIYSGIPHDDYHALPYVSNGYLGKIEECPAAAKVPVEDSPTLLFGRASHAFILEGEEVFREWFCIAPQCDKRTKEGKAIMAAFQDQNAGKDVISDEDFKTISLMREAVHKHPFAATLLTEGLSETTVIWDEVETGIRCKCRPDWQPKDGAGVVIDLKTTADASPKSFTNSVVNYGYARQAAFYLDGISAATGERFDLFAFIAVEKTPPFHVEVYTLDHDFLFYGRQQYKSLLFIEERCRKERFWPHWRFAEPTELKIPGYLKFQENMK